MKNWDLTIKLFKKDYKNIILNSFVVFLCFAICFTMFNLMENDVLKAYVQNKALGIETGNIASSGGNLYSFIALVSSIFVVIVMVYNNRLFFINKRQMIFDMVISGISNNIINSILFSQFFIYSLLSLVAGILFGKFVMIRGFDYFFAYLIEGYSGKAGQIYGFTYIYTISIYLCFTVIELIDQSMYIDGILIGKIADKAKRNTNKHSILIDYFSFLFVLLFFYGVYHYWSHYSGNEYMYILLFFLISFNGILYLFLPGLITVLRKHRLLNNKLLICLSNVCFDLKNTAFFVEVLTISVIVTLTLVLGQGCSSFELSVTLICLAILIFLQTVAIIYKVAFAIKNKVQNYYSLSLLGYSNKEIQHISFSELLIFYFIILVMPFTYIVTISIYNYLYLEMSLLNASILACIYAAPLLLSAILIYALDQGAIKKNVR